MFQAHPYLVVVPKPGVRMTRETEQDWAPYMKQKNLKAIIQVFNDETKTIAQQEKVPFVDPALKGNFVSADFLDEGHFNGQGNEKFAAILASYIKEHVANLVHQSEHERHQIR
jgi:lysophospholipase L1-like esterase